MKKILLLSSLCLISVQAFQWDSYDQFAEYMHYEREYNKAIKMAQKNHKNLFVIEVSESCPFCHKLINEVLVKRSVREYIEKKYIKLIINRDTDANFPKYLERSFTPVTYIIDFSTGYIIDEIDGWMEEDSYLWHL